jgi:hypothetical protein
MWKNCGRMLGFETRCLRGTRASWEKEPYDLGGLASLPMNMKKRARKRMDWTVEDV